MLMVVVIIGLGTLIALPRFRSALGRSNLASARAAVIAMHAIARATAAGGRAAVVRMTGNTVYVTAAPRLKAGVGTRDTVVLPKNLSTIYGVTLTRSVDTIRILQTGIGTNGSTIILAKSVFRDTITINTYGRVLR
jgi:Tfp pilus assembly protein PilE